MTQKRVSFGSKLGMVLATAGSAVGLGNVWRFPYMVGDNGGAAFILLTSSLKKHAFYNLLINNILYLCVT